MNMLAALRLQIEWGADEALDDAPVNRMATPVVVPVPRDTNARAEPATSLTPAPLTTARVLPMRRAQDAAAAAMTREALRAALLAFDGCGLASTATNLVFEDGNADSGLMLVGEGPGAEEDRAGRPFVGPTGLLLDRMMASIGLDRSHFLVTNVIPWRPPGNRNPTEAEIQVCLPFLLRHIALVKPRRLVLLGALATHALLGTKGGMSRLRGRWTKTTVPGLEMPIPTLPMMHPAYLQQNPASRSLAWGDLIQLKRAIESDTK